MKVPFSVFLKDLACPYGRVRKVLDGCIEVATSLRGEEIYYD
jgi:hypothetical protein